MMLLSLIIMASVAASELVLTDGELEIVSEGYKFSEGPIWIPGEGLVFSDVRGNTLYRGNGEVYREPSNFTNGLALDSKGQIIACESGLKRITRIESDGSAKVLVDKVGGKSLNTTNDVAVRSDGFIYFTDPGASSKTELSVNGVYKLNPVTGEIVLLSDVGRYPNGIGFSPDEKTLYVGDYIGGVIRAYDVDASGAVSKEREFAVVQNPDGFAIDTEGRIWTTSRSGIAILSPEGKQLGLIELKSSTNCCFGGPDGKTLFITARSNVQKIRTTATGLGKY